MKRGILSAIFTFLLHFTLFAQNTGSFRGSIQNAITDKYLANAHIKIIQNNAETITDGSGEFSIKNLQAGRYSIQIELEGYKTYLQHNVLIDNGKERILTIKLDEAVAQLDEVQVRLSQAGTINPTSSRTFTTEETQRFAASFYDPARLAASFPGVTTANDQANNISIRGNSPNAMTWRLEGIEIVNPNHLSNAGTLNDRPMQNGGGTIMLSAQLLDNSQFIAGALAPEYGNTVGGLFDMRLRKGNNQKREFTVQGGLLGIDLAAEGPIKKGSKASYLVNYRYSFTGLLANMGVPLGDETIKYQDLAFNLNFPTEHAGNFTIFGMAGNSSNEFGPITDREKEVSKDFLSIDYRSNMYAIGSTHTLALKNNASLRTVLAYSSKGNSRSELDYGLLGSLPKGPFADNLYSNRLSISSTFKKKIGKTAALNTGIYLTNIDDNTSNGNTSSSAKPYMAQLKTWLVQPYAQLLYNASKTNAYVGLHYQYLSFNKTNSLEPRAGLGFQISAKNRIDLSYSLQGQMPSVTAFGSTEAPNFFPQNRMLDFSKAHHFVAAYNYQISQNMKLKAELYQQNHFNVLTTVQKSSLAGVNIWDDYLFSVPLNNLGKAINKGIELSLEQYFVKNTYFLISGTLYQTKYKGSDDIWHFGRFDGRYAANATLGKEWPWNKKAKNRTIGLNLRGIYQGGYRESPVDVESSRFLQSTFYDISAKNIFSTKLPDYFRTDLRLSVKKQKAKYTRTLSLDLQNFTNRQNVGYHYFDWFQDKVIAQKQLGLIPVLNWRAEF